MSARIPEPHERRVINNTCSEMPGECRYHLQLLFIAQIVHPVANREAGGRIHRRPEVEARNIRHAFKDVAVFFQVPSEPLVVLRLLLRQMDSLGAAKS